MSEQTLLDYKNRILTAARDDEVLEIVANVMESNVKQALGAMAQLVLQAHIENEKCAASGIPRNPDMMLSPEQVKRFQFVLQIVGQEPCDVDGEIALWNQWCTDLHETVDDWLPKFIGLHESDGSVRPGWKEATEAAIKRLHEKRLQ